MEYLSPNFDQVSTLLDNTIRSFELIFNDFTSTIDFTAFCLIYSIILFWILRKTNKQAIFRPKNKELIEWKTKLKQSISSFIFRLPIARLIVRKKFEQGLQKVEEELVKTFQKDRDPTKSKKLPLEGITSDVIETRVTGWFKSEEKKMFTGKISGAIYVQDIDHCKEINNFAAKYMYHNPLHLDTYKEVNKMEAQILKMTNSLISKQKAFEVITSGGSESLIMSLYAYKNFYSNIKKPNIVVPNTIHAALDKAAMYFNVEIRKAKLNKRYEANIQHMKSLIDENTICLYGSYPNFPHGIIDPIKEISVLAKKHKIGFHIDGCLGGFVAGFLQQHQSLFTLDNDGVTSISLDHHKFGLAPKGISNLFFKTKELRHSMYFVYTDWVGGIYATPSFPGSRSGFASAGAWYSLTHLGLQQYIKNSKAIQQATKKAAKDLSTIDGIIVFGCPQLCVVSFTCSLIDPFSISSYLSEHKCWKIAPIHKPKGLHVSVTIGNWKNVRNNLAHDVREALEILKKQPQKLTSTSALYGATATLPTESMSDEMVRKMLSSTFK